MGRREFESRLRPPEGRRIPSYPTGPHSYWGQRRVKPFRIDPIDARRTPIEAGVLASAGRRQVDCHDRQCDACGLSDREGFAERDDPDDRTPY